MIKKALQPTNDVFIQFTEEELSSIGAGPGTKLSAKLHDDGSIELRPYVKMEIDIADWSREVLEMLITESCEKDISVNDVICDLLKTSMEESVETYPTKEDLDNAKRQLLLEEDLTKATVDPNSSNSDTSIANF
jgi:hypothetical protein